MQPPLREPFEELSRLRARLRQLVDTTYPPPRPAPPAGAWTPPADITAGPEAITVALEVPGMALEDLRVRTTGRVLTITGQRRRTTVRGETDRQLERPCGSFTRAFTLGYEPQAAEATLADGVLTVVLRR